MTAKNSTVALLLIATGLLAIYSIAHRWNAPSALEPNWGTRKKVESIAASREPAPLLGVVQPREGDEWSPPPGPPGNWYGGFR